ncbi:hypothetical protein cypCar_00043733 [Cyprinus carpio]|nr:hypothetical protein cypCar_00043733 [Cyprinus carpio]
MVGDSVTLHADVTEELRGSNIIWKFGDEIIARMNEADGNPSTYDGPGALFKDRLKLDKQTGSLTITNIRTEHNGSYSVDIRSTIAKLKTFQVTVHGVFSLDGVKKISVRDGDPVPLQTRVTDITGNDVIEWTFGPQNTSIVKTDRVNGRIIYNEDDVRFTNTLHLDIKTGDLTISNTKTDVAGLYHIKIIKSMYTIQKSFSVTVSAQSGAPSGICGAGVGLVVWAVTVFFAARSVFGADGVKSVSVSVMVGDSVTLHTDDTEIQGVLELVWKIQGENKFIAEIDKEINKLSVPGNDEEPFRGRLKLDDQTGSLTITNLTTTDSRVYELQIKNSRETKSKIFNVDVSESGLSLGVVIGIVAAVLLVVAVAAGVIVMICKSKGKSYIQTGQGNST